jgi:HK97 gp10 family phage protein
MSGGVFTILEAIAKFKQFEINLGLAGEAILTEIAILIRDEAKSKIGEYQKGWPKLADSTVKRKGGRDEPLLNTGELKASTSAEVHMSGPEHGVARIGTPLERGFFAEFGTRHEPPRPWLLPAVLESRKDINRIVKKHIHTAWTSAGRDNQMLHLLHALRILLHAARELWSHTIGEDFGK